MKKLLIDFKTSLFGAVAGLPLLVDGVITKDWHKALEGLGLLLLGLFAKDKSDAQNN